MNPNTVYGLKNNYDDNANREELMTKNIDVNNQFEIDAEEYTCIEKEINYLETDGNEKMDHQLDDLNIQPFPSSNVLFSISSESVEQLNLTNSKDPRHSTETNSGELKEIRGKKLNSYSSNMLRTAKNKKLCVRGKETARARNQKTLFAVKLDYLQAKLKHIENEERRKAEAHKNEERMKRKWSCYC
ncbi:hypothetical protein ABEB36_013640 [Hypothenemus hampei]|uniref:Uncharacterized protein n=1 Tax=Hypothenemus hampei TaxID=57062 RepID=A0ABD1E516_HYPHA